MFELDKSQKEIRKAARDFARGEFDKELACELEKNGEFPEQIWKKAAELGFIGIHFPEACSGGDMGMLESALIVEEFCRKDSSIGGALSLAGFASECVLRYGSDELKSRFLTPVAEGDMLSGGAFSETRHGASLAAIETTAVKTGDQWIVNGSKTNVVNGGQAGFYVVLCRTDPEAPSPEAGQSLILVEGDRPGISSRDLGKKLGGNMTATADLSFEKVSVPLGNLIGKEGDGNPQLKIFFDESRILRAAQSLGTALGSLDRVLEYVKERVQFGRKIGEFQASRHKIADMATQIELARLITYKAAWSRDQGKPDDALSAMAKMTAARTAMEVGAQTIQLYGGYGYMTEYEVERFYRDAKVAEIHEGARDTQKDVIAAAVIGRIK